MMKKIPIWSLVLLLVLSLIGILRYQCNDTMLMKHWLELVWLEFLVQLIYNKLDTKNHGQNIHT